jgi:uncharacterized protein (TIGR02246 family)
MSGRDKMTTPAPNDCDRAFAACVKARDLDGLMALYETDARYVRRDGSIVIGCAAIRSLLQSLTNTPTDIEIHIVSVVALSGIAVIYNDWTTRTPGEDGCVHESTGQAVEIVRRQPDGRWLFAIDDPFGRSRHFSHPLTQSSR